jgi:DNA-binding FrmR family transcriptional regulator
MSDGTAGGTSAGRTRTADSATGTRTTAGRGGSAVRGYSGTKDAHLKRLARIEGQVRGISRMVQEDSYCIDVLTQVSAVTKALQAVSLGLLEEHMAHCVAHAVAAGGDEGAAKLKEASDAIARLVRS